MIIEEQFANVIEERKVAVDGVISQVLVAGDGPPVVLLHGDGDSAAVWQRVIPALARDHRVFAVSLPGHSDTDKARSDYTREYMREFISGVLDALEIGRCLFIGNSIGGQVAIHLALAEPERFRALVLVDSSGLGWAVNPSLAIETIPWLGELAKAFAQAPMGGKLRKVSRASELFWRKDHAPASWLAEQARLAKVPGFLDAAIAAKRTVVSPLGQREVLLDQLHRLTMPTLVVWGANDLVLPVTQAHAAMRRLPDAELAVIADCGHMPHVERPDEFLNAVVPFLGRHARAVDEAPPTSGATTDTASGDGSASLSPVKRTMQSITKKRS